MKWLLLVMLLGAQNSTLDSAKKETLLQWLFRVTGISAAPRARGNALRAAGEACSYSLADGTVSCVGGMFRSPIRDGDGVLWAATDEGIVRPPEKQVVCRVAGVTRLVGFTPDRRLVVIGTASETPGMWDVHRGCKFEAAAAGDSGIGSLADWDTVYPGDVRVWMKERAIAIREEGVERELLSYPDNDIGQPALSADGKSITFVRVRKRGK